MPRERLDDPTRGNDPSATSDWLSGVRDLLLEVLASDAREFEVQDGSFRLRIRRGTPTHWESGVVGQPAAEAAAALAAIRAPLTGVFYGGPSPGAARYVQVGEHVAIGTVVGLIEAMKVFNEVLADAAGTIAQIVVADGSLVRAGEELILIDSGEGAPSAAKRP